MNNLLPTFIVIAILVVNAAADSSLEVWTDYLNLDNSEATPLAKFDGTLEFRRRSIAVGNDDPKESVAQQLAVHWVKGASIEWGQNGSLSEQWLSRFPKLIRPDEDQKTGYASAYYSLSLTYYVQDRMTKSVKRIGVVPSIKSDWTEEYELMRSALRHIKLALKKGTEGQFDAKQMQKHFKSVNGVYSNISDWVASKAKLVEPSTGPARATESKSPELSRFAALHAGGYHDFVCSRDTNSGKGITSPWLTLKAGNGKEWAIRYKVPVFGQNTGSGGLATNDRQDLTGTKMNVRFNKLGHPVSIKNTANGNFCEVIEWRVTGYGW